MFHRVCGVISLITSLRSVRHQSHMKYALSVLGRDIDSINAIVSRRSALTVVKTTEPWLINAQKGRR